MLQCHAQTMTLSDEVEYIVDYVWREAMGTLAAILAVPVRSMSLEKVCSSSVNCYENKNLDLQNTGSYLYY